MEFDREVYGDSTGIISGFYKDYTGNSIGIHNKNYKQRYRVPCGFYRDSIKDSIWIAKGFYMEFDEDPMGRALRAHRNMCLYMGARRIRGLEYECHQGKLRH